MRASCSPDAAGCGTTIVRVSAPPQARDATEYTLTGQRAANEVSVRTSASTPSTCCRQVERQAELLHGIERDSSSPGWPVDHLGAVLCVLEDGQQKRDAETFEGRVQDAERLQNGDREPSHPRHAEHAVDWAEAGERLQRGDQVLGMPRPGRTRRATTAAHARTGRRGVVSAGPPR